MIRTKGLREWSAEKAATLRDLMTLVNEQVMPALSTMQTAWNRELIPSLVRMDKTLLRATGNVVVLTTESMTMDIDTALLLVDCSAGDVTVTLPDPTTAWRRMAIKKFDATANKVLVVAPAGSAIDGMSGKNLTIQYNWLTVLSDSAQYWQV